MLPSELRLTSLKHCYVHLPETFASKEPAIKGGALVSIKSIQNDHELCVMWNGQLTAGEHVELDRDFAKANQLQDELVIINSIDNIEPVECSLCCTELVNSSEYEIVSQHTDLNLLNTCRLISKNLVVPIYVETHVTVLVRIMSFQPNQPFGLLTKWTEMSFQHNLEKTLTKDESNTTGEQTGQISSTIPFVSSVLSTQLMQSKFHPTSLLICGDRGSGKTYTINRILTDHKHYYSESLNCNQFRGKRPESIRKKFIDMFTAAVEKQPAIIALDDIDSFLGCDQKHEQEHGHDLIYKQRLIDCFCYFLKQIERQDRAFIVVIAACRSLDLLDKRISQPKGRQYFNEIIKLTAPDLHSRSNILKTIANQNNQVCCGLSEQQYEDIASKCSAFMPMDLKCLYERALLVACTRTSLNFDSDPVTLELDDFLGSLNGYVPINLRSVTLQPKTGRTFDSVGGMGKIKEILIKTILLPLKYEKLFKRCPLPQQNSILLYGPPGCGKTLVAEALINQEGINSICVRGPELLSKYIGASEAAVRKVFYQAQMARPCVIFFDEFESLVAKRGSDSTGVTDRVVNQFLTILDGVERLSHDVFIVAATSRPDMIDPAMLRPGRLDKHIYCPMPDQNDRHAILEVHSSKLDLNSSVDLAEWASRTDKFTGADLQALLFAAQLKALHETIEKNESLKVPKAKNELKIIIDYNHLNAAYNDMFETIQSKYAELLAKYPPTIGLVQKQRVSMRATLA